MTTWKTTVTHKLVGLLSTDSRQDVEFDYKLVLGKRRRSDMSGVYHTLRHWVMSLLERYVFDQGK